MPLQNAADEALLKGRYIHTSGHWNKPLGKLTPSGFKLVYINAPGVDGVRLQPPMYRVGPDFVDDQPPLLTVFSQ